MTYEDLIPSPIDVYAYGSTVFNKSSAMRAAFEFEATLLIDAPTPTPVAPMLTQRATVTADQIRLFGDSAADWRYGLVMVSDNSSEFVMVLPISRTITPARTRDVVLKRRIPKLGYPVFQLWNTRLLTKEAVSAAPVVTRIIPSYMDCLHACLAYRLDVEETTGVGYITGGFVDREENDAVTQYVSNDTGFWERIEFVPGV